MQGLMIEFDWVKCADYRLEEAPGTPGTLLSEIGRSELVGFGSRLVTRPIEQLPGLYLELAKSEPTLDGHVAFAKKYGLLTHRERESTTQWPELIDNVSKLITRIGNPTEWPIDGGKYIPYEAGRFTLRFGPRGNRPDEIGTGIVPRNLYTALILQCVLSRSGGAEIRACKACGTLFEIGGNSGRRSHREFCSDKCRFDYSHRKREKKK